jgi:hypothetical protein
MKTIVQKTTPGEMPFPWSEKDPYRLPVSIDRVQKLLVTLGGAAGADQGSIAAGVEEGQPGSQLQAPGNAGVHALQQGLVCAPAALAPGRLAVQYCTKSTKPAAVITCQQQRPPCKHSLCFL